MSKPFRAPQLSVKEISDSRTVLLQTTEHTPHLSLMCLNLNRPPHPFKSKEVYQILDTKAQDRK